MYTNRLLVEIVYAQVFWLNAFPAINGISDYRSPRNIITGATIDYHLHCQLECGSYVQTHEAHGNNMQPWTIGAIALRPTGNVQGGFYFYNLTTGDIIRHRSWTPLPMPKDFIHQGPSVQFCCVFSLPAVCKASCLYSSIMLSLRNISVSHWCSYWLLIMFCCLFCRISLCPLLSSKSWLHMHGASA